MRSIFFYFFLFSVFSESNLIKFRVVDKLNNPIADAYIKTNGGDVITKSNEMGYFYLKETIQNDLIIGRSGYFPILFPEIKNDKKEELFLVSLQKKLCQNFLNDITLLNKKNRLARLKKFFANRTFEECDESFEELLYYDKSLHDDITLLMSDQNKDVSMNASSFHKVLYVTDKNFNIPKKIKDGNLQKVVDSIVDYMNNDFSTDASNSFSVDGDSQQYSVSYVKKKQFFNKTKTKCIIVLSSGLDSEFICVINEDEKLWSWVYIK